MKNFIRQYLQYVETAATMFSELLAAEEHITPYWEFSPIDTRTKKEKAIDEKVCGILQQ